MYGIYETRNLPGIVYGQYDVVLEEHSEGLDWREEMLVVVDSSSYVGSLG